MIHTLTFQSGATVCASEPGVFCRFVRTAMARSFGRQAWVCNLYEAPLIDKDGWLHRCNQCMAEFPAKDAK